MCVLQATSNDLIEILYLLKVCFYEVNSEGLFHLDSQSALITPDLQKGNIYLYKKNGVTLGMIVLDMDDHPEYITNSGTKKSENILVANRLAVHPNWKGKGIENELVRFIDQFALLKGYTSVRIDTLSEDKEAVKSIG
jgi:GNAT superfamily N-acetyltransferase